jgi:hypothetical protein
MTTEVPCAVTMTEVLCVEEGTAGVTVPHEMKEMTGEAVLEAEVTVMTAESLGLMTVEGEMLGAIEEVVVKKEEEVAAAPGLGGTPLGLFQEMMVLLESAPEMTTKGHHEDLPGTGLPVKNLESPGGHPRVRERVKAKVLLFSLAS